MRLALASAALGLALSCAAAAPALADWAATLAAARGQTVYWNAWGGDARTNAFITWVGSRTQALYGVEVRQVKLSDTAEAVTRVLSEKAAGQDSGGSVDLIWINGPNFLAMKDQGLLHGPFSTDLPNAKYLDLSTGSAATTDFTVPVDGLESPWRLAKFVFVHDSARAPSPPRSMAGFSDWAAAHPGRMTHPNPSNFMGATFLKQALVELAPDAAALAMPVTDAAYQVATAPLWSWYDALRPNLWRGGTAFPENQSVQQQMLNDGEIDISMSFDPASTAAAIDQGLLPDTARVFVPDGGTIGNVSFVAIPYNAAHSEGAEVVANFLLAPETQAYMQDINVLGAFSVLDPARLDPAAQAAFDALPGAPALPRLRDLGPTLAEPHPSWMTRLTRDWARRYTR
ncbi:ABC transporter substrate-binding protein [Pseudooceanicola sediminis]|uniref:ABC transporter substrate-binding protein n=1 Tax=Pseudooceanicola sediminis TaxID=2211117 RepID=A0A399J0D8_9RHOB|nr:ABC transporter substrate-binding protein [Pseudooceanicola sediminis]KAA2315083.1 ABC transporter substrate-binding protein [Puniceibacterium sp. HSS470]RII38898.1 ABC transporter substrate-binding protein [Pseudooceanicola sediminis]|tara:strand:+ start:29073 stop:30272 length:1200 start_codon:yes stop_codon:yes gene_type:complete